MEPLRVLRNVFLLALCQALMLTCMSLIGTVSGLVGYSLVEDKAFATLPHALQFVGMMAITYPASLLMELHLRRQNDNIAQRQWNTQ